MKINKISLLSGIAAMFLTGCITFDPTNVGPLDSKVDEQNQPAVVQAVKIANERGKFKRKVMIKPSEKAGLFMTMRLHQVPGEWRRDLLMTMDSKLTEIVSSMKDFELVNTEAGNLATPGVQISAVPAAGSSNGVYLLTYNILNASFTENNIHKIGTAIAGNFIHDRNTANKINRTAQQVDIWHAHVTVEVMLSDPSGKRIFTFNKKVTNTSLFNRRPDFNNMKAAVEQAAAGAMSSYAKKYAPPLYVVETVCNGNFAKLSHGANYGIARGQKVSFYQTVKRRSVTDPSGYEDAKRYIGSGVVGIRGAPVEFDHAWVYVKDNDTPETNRVMMWTSAEIR